MREKALALFLNLRNMRGMRRVGIDVNAVEGIVERTNANSLSIARQRRFKRRGESNSEEDIFTRESNRAISLRRAPRGWD